MTQVGRKMWNVVHYMCFKYSKQKKVTNKESEVNLPDTFAQHGLHTTCCEKKELALSLPCPCLQPDH